MLVPVVTLLQIRDLLAVEPPEEVVLPMRMHPLRQVVVQRLLEEEVVDIRILWMIMILRVVGDLMVVVVGLRGLDIMCHLLLLLVVVVGRNDLHMIIPNTYFPAIIIATHHLLTLEIHPQSATVLPSSQEANEIG